MNQSAWQDLYGKTCRDAQTAMIRSRQARRPLGEAEAAELAEMGMTSPMVICQQDEGPCTHLYLSAMLNGEERFGWWLDGDGAADIKWTKEME
jgi:hypothetical protein